jgi:hypothetical protein
MHVRDAEYYRDRDYDDNQSDDVYNLTSQRHQRALRDDHDVAHEGSGLMDDFDQLMQSEYHYGVDACEGDARLNGSEGPVDLRDSGRLQQWHRDEPPREEDAGSADQQLGVRSDDDDDDDDDDDEGFDQQVVDALIGYSDGDEAHVQEGMSSAHEDQRSDTEHPQQGLDEQEDQDACAHGAASTECWDAEGMDGAGHIMAETAAAGHRDEQQEMAARERERQMQEDEALARQLVRVICCVHRIEGYRQRGVCFL